MLIEKIKCDCCGTEYLSEVYWDCPYCDWEYDGVPFEDEEIWDEESKGPNPICLGKAREMLKKGLDIWGKPLPAFSVNLELEQVKEFAASKSQGLFKDAIYYGNLIGCRTCYRTYIVYDKKINAGDYVSSSTYVMIDKNRNMQLVTETEMRQILDDISDDN